MNIQAQDMHANDDQRANQTQRVPPYTQQQAAPNQTQYVPQHHLPLYNNQPNVMYMYNSQPQGFGLFMYQAKSHLIWSVVNTITGFFFLYG